jgi:hypothetical protein
MTTRYAAPVSFTTVNAAAEVASSALSPTAAAATWTTDPVWIPRTDTSPARRPWSTLRVTM